MNQRFYSLDVFRGATVALMILVNNPGSWGHIYPPLEHASWHGCYTNRFGFSFFFICRWQCHGFCNAQTGSCRRKYFLEKVIKRTLLIFFIGLFLNWFPFIKYNDAGQHCSANLLKTSAYLVYCNALPSVIFLHQ